MTITEYLETQHTSQTVQSYEREIIHYVAKVGASKALNAQYSDLMDYVGYLRKVHGNVKTIRRCLHSIKKYYNYLVAVGLRKDNPSKYIYLKDKISKDIQLQDLFKKEELELLLNVNERYQILRNRNRLIVSLLIYQGLHSEEILKLNKECIDLEKGEIKVLGSDRINGRTLKLKPNQVMMFWKYLHEDHPKLKGSEGDFWKGLRSGFRGVDAIHRLIERCKYLFTNRNLTPITIRQSVIVNLLKSGNDLRFVQVFAGHKHVSSTERYRQNEVEELKRQVLKYHPLG